MPYIAVVIALIILIAAVYAAAWRGGVAGRAPVSVREGYGPPPGARRALSHEELDSRGWAEFPYEYAANTASAISHLVERSA